MRYFCNELAPSTANNQRTTKSYTKTNPMTNNPVPS